MVVLTAEIYFDLEYGQQDAVTIIDDLIAEMEIARDSASRNELRVGPGRVISHPHNVGLLSGHWWIDATSAMFRQRFQPIDVDGNWHILDHKHPEFISPVFSEVDARRCAEEWSSSSAPGPC